MRTVAIVGFYGPTLPHLLKSHADEVWCSNHGLMVMGGKEVPRCTRVFEIHKESWFRRKELPVHEKYWEWLCTPRGIPIYLQDPIPDIPDGRVYPYEDVCADLFPHLLRRSNDGEETPEKFLTSTASFMLALAIHEKFDRVEVYGIGMETNTEYAYQLPGFTYMVGFANGRGIDVVQMEESPICKAEVYAYNAIPYMSIERLRELQRLYQWMFEEKAAQSKEIIGKFNQGEIKDQEAAMRASDIAAAHNGAVQAINVLIEQDSQYMSRQALEVKKRDFVVSTNDYQSQTNACSGEYVQLLKRKKTAQAVEMWKKYLHARASMHANSGAVQVLNNLIEECDLRKPVHQIVLTIEDK